MNTSELARERKRGMVYVAMIALVAMALDSCEIALAQNDLASDQDHAAVPFLWDAEVVPVYHNPEGAVVPIDYADRAIQWSMDRWNYADVGVTFEWAGQTDAEWVYGAVVVRHVAAQDVNGRLRRRGLVHADRVEVHQAQIVISTVHRLVAGDCWHGTMLHEMGHAAGIHGHNPEHGHVMSRGSWCNTQLTAADIKMLGGNPCQIELLPSNDLHFAAVWDGDATVQASLVYSESDYGQGWTIGHAEAVDASCEPLKTLGDAVVLDVWGRGASYRAWITQTGPDRFRLDRAIEVTQ